MAFSCTTCAISFDLDNHLPYVIPCGHSICRVCKCLSSQNCDLSCSACNIKLPMRDFPLNYAIRDQLQSASSEVAQDCTSCPEDGSNLILQVNEKQEPTLRVSFWNCCECGFALHPRQARLCIKCCPKDLIVNGGTSVSIRDYDKCEARLICAHCVMEGEHKFHITKVYLPIKMNQKGEESSNELMGRIKRMKISRKEESDLHQVLSDLRAKSGLCSSWHAFEQMWNEADASISNIQLAIKSLTVKILTLEETLKDIESMDQRKTELFEQMKTSMNAKSSETMLRKSSEDSGCEDADYTSLRRFGGAYNLSVV